MTGGRDTKDLLLGAVLLALALAMLGWLFVDLAAATPVGGLMVAMAAGLLVTPDDFVNTTTKGPTTPEGARRLGVVLTAVLLLGGAWCWRRARRSRRGPR